MEILTSEQLLKQQLNEIQVKQASKAKGIQPDKQGGISYNAQLQKLVSMIKKDINEMLVPQVRTLEPEYTADGWFDVTENILNALRAKWMSEAFLAQYQRVASDFVLSANQSNQKKMEKEFKKFGINVFSSPSIEEYVTAAAKSNAQLIKTIPEQYLNQVESIVTTNMRSGMRSSNIIKQLSQQFGVTQRRAKFISRDQTAKINSDLASKRMKASGIEYFKWSDSDDQRVRDRHEQIANKLTAYGRGIYRWDNLPLSGKGQPIAPGQDYACRCIAIPILKSQVEKNQKSGNVAKGVYR